MLKNTLIISLFSLIIFVFGANSMPLYNKNCTVAVNSSSGAFYQTSSFSFKDAFLSDGASATYPLNYDYTSKIINYYNAKLVTKSALEGYCNNYYYYTPSLPNSVVINGKKVNVHIAVSDNCVTVGYPIIYYAY